MIETLLLGVGKVSVALLQLLHPQTQLFVLTLSARLQFFQSFARFYGKAINFLLILENALVNVANLVKNAVHLGFDGFGFFGSRFGGQNLIHRNTSTPITSQERTRLLSPTFHHCCRTTRAPSTTSRPARDKRRQPTRKKASAPLVTRTDTFTVFAVARRQWGKLIPYRNS